MASLNPLTRELVFKIVFYGPGLGGKTTTLQFIHATTKPEHRGKMVSLATPTDRTLYFDFLPLRVPRVRGMSVRLQLFTVPGQVYYGATRKLVLSGADGVVFVADSQSGRMDANQESLEDLNANLVEHNRELAKMPHTFHWNKRDLSDLVPLEELDRRFNVHAAPSLGTCATRGDGVFEGLERITRLVLRAYEAELPKNASQPIAIGAAGGTEVSIAEAIRGLAEAPLVTKVTPFAGISAVKPEEARPSAESEARLTAAAKTVPPKQGAVPPEAHRTQTAKDLGPAAEIAIAAASAPGFDHAARASRADVPPPPESAPSSALEREKRVSTPPAPNGHGAEAKGSSAQGSPPAPGVTTIAPPPGTSHFSMADLWPEADRESVRQTETLIGARDANGAVLACDVLLTRILASAAGVAGAVDAPRDPGLVSLLLGLDGRRYLAFRGAVRAARQKEEVSLKDALDCFAFVLEARGAREAVGK